MAAADGNRDPKSRFVFREAIETDVDAVIAIESEVYGPTAWSRDTVRRELTTERAHYIVTETTHAPETAETSDIVSAVGSAVGGESARERPAEARIAGYAGVLVSHDDHRADIQTITVAQPWRRRGLGRALALALVRRAGAHGAREVFLEVRDDNPHARALYRSLGFATVGSRQDFSVPGGVTVVVMRLTLAGTASSRPGPRVHGSTGAA